MGWA
jgi:hypothetical protein